MRHPTPGKGREGRGSPVEGAKFKPGYFPHLITHPTSRLHDRTGASRSPSTSVQRTHQRQKGLHMAPRAKRGWSQTALAPGTHSTQLFRWHTSPILFSCCPLNHFFSGSQDALSRSWLPRKPSSTMVPSKGTVIVDLVALAH